MPRRIRGRNILILLFVIAGLLYSYGCSSTPDLILEDPAFRYDMVEDAIAGKKFVITREDYPEIRKLFYDERPSYRLAGVLLAEQTGDDFFYPLIAEAALDTEPVVADRALEIMKANPEAYRPSLLALLENENPLIRLGALQLLGSTGREDLVPLFISFFDDLDPEVRNQATLSVRAVTGRDNPFLREALDSDQVMTIAMAIRTLGGYLDIRDMEAYIAGFAADDARIRRESQLAALKTGLIGLPSLHEVASDPERSYRERLSSLEVMQGLRSVRSIETLIGLLVDSDQRIAGKAQSVLGTYGVEAVSALADLYRRSDTDYRLQSVRLLSEIGGRSSYPALIEALGDDDPTIRSTAYQALASAEDDAWPALRNALLSDNPEVLSLLVNLLLDGPDPRLAIDENGEANTEGLFLTITLSDRTEIEKYLEVIGARPLIVETVLALKDAWEAGDEFAELEADIAAESDSYLLAWRQREQLSVASRTALRESFEKLHEYFESEDPSVLTESKEIREESRRLEIEARELKRQLDSMDPATIARGQARLERYRTSRDFLVRTWEYVIPALQPLAEKVYSDRDLDPNALSRESALLD